MINSYTSKTLEDFEFDNDGTYSWDCYNIHTCAKYTPKELNKHGCLKGSKSARCSLDEKEAIFSKYPRVKQGNW